MADAFCGPSNALQNFKQHTQGDRSLQQDRLTGPRTAAQGFRTHDPRAGSLDAEFDAFENAAPSQFQEPFVGNNFAPHARFQHAAPSNWADDFQQLSVSDHPLPSQQFRNHAPMIRTTNAGWHNDFMKQQSVGQISVAQEKQIAFNKQNMSAYTPQIQFSGSFMPTSSLSTQTNTYQPQQVQSMDQMAGADWSQAFEDAFQDAFKEVKQAEQLDIGQESSLSHDHGSQEAAHLTDIRQPDHIPIGSDAIDYTEMKDRTIDHETQDASALARVAGELLHNVQHDSSEKFQNSQFLDLMRKIRDRQVEVRNNDFESTTVAADHSFTQMPQNIVSTNDHETKNAPDPIQDQDTFAFPNMNTVYTPREADFVDYSFDSDQYPAQHRNQMSDLHPGGRYYPEQSSSGTYAQMSGAVSTLNGGASSTSITADEFEAAHDENRSLASRFQRTAA